MKKRFRMSKSGLHVQSVYHRKNDSIGVHLTIVRDALAARR